MWKAIRHNFELVPLGSPSSPCFKNFLTDMRRCDYFEGTSGFKNLKSVSRGAWSKLRSWSVLIGSDFIDKNEVWIRWPREITNILLSFRVPFYLNLLLLHISIFVLFASNYSFLFFFFLILNLYLWTKISSSILKGNSSSNLIHLLRIRVATVNS